MPGYSPGICDNESDRKLRSARTLNAEFHCLWYDGYEAGTRVTHCCEMILTQAAGNVKTAVVSNMEKRRRDAFRYKAVHRQRARNPTRDRSLAVLKVVESGVKQSRAYPGVAVSGVSYGPAHSPDAFQTWLCRQCTRRHALHGLHRNRSGPVRRLGAHNRRPCIRGTSLDKRWRRVRQAALHRILRPAVQ